MAKLVWDQTGERKYENGCDRGVLYPMASGVYQNGVAWDGLVSVTDSPSGNEETATYADNIKYLSIRSAATYGFTIEYLYSPPEFDACNGMYEAAPGVILGQQKLSPFGFSWRTLIGNDTEGTDFGYKIHLAYNAMVTPTEHAYNTTNESPEATTLSNEATTTPIPVNFTGDDGKPLKPTAQIVIDSTKVSAAALKKLEDILYGTNGDDAKEARLPLPDEVLTLLAEG